MAHVGQPKGGHASVSAVGTRVEDGGATAQPWRPGLDERIAQIGEPRMTGTARHSSAWRFLLPPGVAHHGRVTTTPPERVSRRYEAAPADAGDLGRGRLRNGTLVVTDGLCPGNRGISRMWSARRRTQGRRSEETCRVPDPFLGRAHPSVRTREAQRLVSVRPAHQERRLPVRALYLDDLSLATVLLRRVALHQQQIADVRPQGSSSCRCPHDAPRLPRGQQP